VGATQGHDGLGTRFLRTYHNRRYRGYGTRQSPVEHAKPSVMCLRLVTTSTIPSSFKFDLGLRFSVVGIRAVGANGALESRKFLLDIRHYNEELLKEILFASRSLSELCRGLLTFALRKRSDSDRKSISHLSFLLSLVISGGELRLYWCVSWDTQAVTAQQCSGLVASHRLA
jgi:hypothetical protein